MQCRFVAQVRSQLFSSINRLKYECVTQLFQKSGIVSYRSNGIIKLKKNNVHILGMLINKKNLLFYIILFEINRNLMLLCL